MAITFITTDMTKWGVGKGSPGSASEHDNSFWSLHERVLELENNPPQAVSIDSIVQFDDQLLIILTDASEQGPFNLPTASFRFRGEWEPDTIYFKNDVVRHTRTGIYLVQFDHVSDTTFDPGAQSEDSDTSGEFIYELMMPATRYLISCFIPGKPGFFSEVTDPMFAHVASDIFVLQATLPDAQGRLTVAPTSNFDGSIHRNGVEIGTFQILAGQTTATFTFADDVIFQIGDILSIPRVATIDDTARNLMITFAGVKMGQT